MYVTNPSGGGLDGRASAYRTEGRNSDLRGYCLPLCLWYGAQARNCQALTSGEFYE